MSLIIVESPTKARTFNRLLDKNKYFVFATLGHFRDLPKKSMSIDYKNKFKPGYKIIPSKNLIVKKLKELAEKNSEIILATDPDREGEAIAYHTAYVLGLINEKWPEIEIITNKKKLKRIVFHEITLNALKNALENPENLRINLVKAQQARRILDRIVGYELSPILWKKTNKYWLSAGRVQTVVLRIIVEREKEIKKFKETSYYQIYVDFKNSILLKARLFKINEKPIEETTKIKLFSGDYEFIKTIITDHNLKDILSDIKSDKYKISDIQEEIITKFPPPPFITSSLQQDAYYKFRFPTKMTMKLAQYLYERGLISYHRTDSYNLSTKFVFAAKDYIESVYGKEYSLEKPRSFRMRSKLSQEAHEAIRPTRMQNNPNSKIIQSLGSNYKKLYELIFTRSVSSQMKEAKVKMQKIFISGEKKYEFLSENQKFIFDGFLKLLNPTFVKKHQIEISPKKDELLKIQDIVTDKKLTNPPPRYSEASLIKIMEQRGIGRPSTYAPIISLIQTRGYISKEEGYFIPTGLGNAVSDYLTNSFNDIFEIDFTAKMEDDLDEIATSKKDLIETLNEFYSYFHKNIVRESENKDLIKIIEKSEGTCPKCKKPLNIRYSRFGKFYACTGYPACKYTKSFVYYVKDKKCPQCGGRIVIKYSRKKIRFYACENYPKCKFTEFSYKKL